ncbi:DUF4625 domain-containing protein [Echinicola sp. 20G]|uniref:DUF4625 domain-containing protein n=1 Tax=Echinicola sp. 20G TaxID=2781961 RepID=UPI00190FF797|nr:DUF4625 domain-containing protein [Echinicola sp. 20G]
MKKINKLLLIIPVLLLIFPSCSDEDHTPKILPTVSNIEVGLNNIEIGVVGQDFHFNADVLAGDLLEAVQINIEQRSEETYAEPWSFEVVFTERIEGLKNANLHRHFDIPAEAPKGIYDFIITVKDQNGTSVEETREISLIDIKDYPDIFPHVKVFGVDKIGLDGKGGFNNFYNNGDFRNPDDPSFSKDESIWSSVQIGNIKDNGVMYGLLIKKSHDHKPETVGDIDFSKAIVTDIKEHSGYEEIRAFGNSYNANFNNHYMYGAALEIGATEDNHLPNPNPITGAKAWENGTYYYGYVYTNTTYNMSTFRYIEIEIKGF